MTKEQCKASGGIFTTAGSCLGSAGSIYSVPGLVSVNPLTGAPQGQQVASNMVADATSRRLTREKWLPWIIVGGIGAAAFVILKYKRIL